MLDEQTTERPAEPWERLQRETDAQWAAFKYYRDMVPIERTMLAAWSAYAVERTGEPPKNKRAPGYFAAWSSANDWVARVLAFDRYQDAASVARMEIDHVAKLNGFRERLLSYAEASTRNAIRAMAIIERSLEVFEKDTELVLCPRELPKFIQATAKLFETAAEQESRALAVDSLLEVLGDENKLTKLH